MASATDAATMLAYDDEGAGPPVVLLHGMTFDRRSWRPVIAQLGASVRSIAIDLPGHGESGGTPAPLEEVAALVHELIDRLGVERPIVVGHSMSGGVVTAYAAAYPSAGLVLIDIGPDIRPIAGLAQQLEPALRGPGFAEAWRTFEDSLGLDRLPEPERSLVLDTHQVDQRVVLGYWEPMLTTDPNELQASIDAQIRQIDVPCLAVFGRSITDAERERFEWMPDVQIEEWAGGGHCVHLVDVDRFASRLRQFIDHCAVTG